MKFNKSDILTTRYGGVIPIVKEMMKRGMPALIDAHIGKHLKRKHNSKYKFSDMFLSWIAASLCGAIRIDHVTGLKENLEVISGLNVPSHDTMGRMMKLLSTEVKSQDRKMNTQVNENYYDSNIMLNSLLIKATKSMGILNENDEYILDVDCTFIETRCAGAISMKDKDAPGFYPMICLIGNLPVFIEMRNGNSIADFRIEECIEHCLDILDESKIKIKKVRTDGAGYRKGLLQMLEKRKIEFITASPVNITYKKMFDSFDSTSWEDVTIETANANKECQIGEIEYLMHGVGTPFRIIALRIPTDDKLKMELDDDEIKHKDLIKKKMSVLRQKGLLKRNNKRYREGNWNEIRGFQYKMIATNDFNSPAEELMKLYNQRGEAERQFDFMKNDFGWKLPPFMNMNENTVFFILTALANNVFRAVAQIFNEHIDELELNARVRRFQKAFINTVAINMNGKWIFYNEKIV